MTTNSESNSKSVAWYREMKSYHWIVFLVCSLGWAFDCMDQHLFTVVRANAVSDLMHISSASKEAASTAASATFIMIIGWATGGIIFGILGDKFGRARIMIFTILIYSLLTGLSAFSWNLFIFMFIRFFAGIGIGGQFAVGASLVAETMPSNARPYVLGLMQAISALGNIGAALVAMTFNTLRDQNMLPLGNSDWRCIFLFGSIPALLAYFVIRYLKEPESWQKSVSEPGGRKRAGSISEMFTTPIWRKHVILGMILASTGVIGAWGIGLFSIELIDGVVRKNAPKEAWYQKAEAESLQKHQLTAADKDAAPDEVKQDIEDALAHAVKGEAGFRKALNLLIYNVGAFFGMYAFSIAAVFFGRRTTFTFFMIGCIIAVVTTFLFMDSWATQLILVPIMGFFTMSMFSGYTIYFPELFPTRLRSTGVSFCYNVGRYIAAFGPLVLSVLILRVYGHLEKIDPTLPLRYAGITMCLVFVIGIIVVWFLPETKGKPLPE
jgi:MFS family permease